MMATSFISTSPFLVDDAKCTMYTDRKEAEAVGWAAHSESLFASSYQTHLINLPQSIHLDDADSPSYSRPTSASSHLTAPSMMPGSSSGTTASSSMLDTVNPSSDWLPESEGIPVMETNDYEDDGALDEMPASRHVSSNKGKGRRRTTPDQFRILETKFAEVPKPDVALRAQLSDMLGMTPREVQVWFQNRRAKAKKLASKPEKGRDIFNHYSIGLVRTTSAGGSTPPRRPSVHRFVSESSRDQIDGNINSMYGVNDYHHYPLAQAHHTSNFVFPPLEDTAPSIAVDPSSPYVSEVSSPGNSALARRASVPVAVHQHQARLAAAAVAVAAASGTAAAEPSLYTEKWSSPAPLSMLMPVTGSAIPAEWPIPPASSSSDTYLADSDAYRSANEDIAPGSIAPAALSLHMPLLPRTESGPWLESGPSSTSTAFTDFAFMNRRGSIASDGSGLSEAGTQTGMLTPVSVPSLCSVATTSATSTESLYPYGFDAAARRASCPAEFIAAFDELGHSPQSHLPAFGEWINPPLLTSHTSTTGAGFLQATAAAAGQSPMGRRHSVAVDPSYQGVAPSTSPFRHYQPAQLGHFADATFAPGMLRRVTSSTFGRRGSVASLLDPIAENGGLPPSPTHVGAHRRGSVARKVRSQTQMRQHYTRPLHQFNASDTVDGVSPVERY